MSHFRAKGTGALEVGDIVRHAGDMTTVSAIRWTRSRKLAVVDVTFPGGSSESGTVTADHEWSVRCNPWGEWECTQCGR